MAMKNYDLELSIVLDDHGYQQALGLQAKTGRNKSKILKMYSDGWQLINSDSSVSVSAFTSKRTVRINFIGHGDPGSTSVSDTDDKRTWNADQLATDLRKAVEWALPERSKFMFQRLSLIVCYGGGHTYVTQNQYGHHIHPKDSFGYKCFEKLNSWVVDMTARGDVSTTQISKKHGSPANSLNYSDYTGAYKTVGDDNARKDKYRKIRFYKKGNQIEVEWPYLGYD